MTRSRRLLQTVSALALVAVPVTALAQEQKVEAQQVADATEVAEAGIIEDIIVYAQRRGQKASDVPLALSVLTGDDLLKAEQIKTTNDVLQFVPNAQALQPHGPSRARWFVRGIGTNNTGNNTVNPLGIYYDDVYIADIANQGYPLFDLERVEVLNGPQGTLWGKNSNSGAVNFVSKAPSFNKDGYAKLGFGSFNEKQLEAAVGGPIVGDKVAARAAFYYNDWDGWQKNSFTGGHHPGGRDVAGRVQLLFKPTEDLSIQLNAHGRDFSGTQQGYRYVPSTFTTTTTPAWRSVYTTGYVVGQEDETHWSNTTPETLKAGGTNAKIVWDGKGFSITSITAYEDNQQSVETGVAPIPVSSPYYNNGVPFSQLDTEYDSWQVSEELRVTSTDDGPLTWLGGLYAFKGVLDNRAVQAYYVRGNPGSAASTGNAWGAGPQLTDSAYRQETKNFAGFGNVGYSFTEALKLSGGVRWSRETSSFDWDYSAAIIAGTQATFISNLPQVNYSLYRPRDLIFAERATQKTSSWTYDVTPEYIFDEHFRSYFRYAHGVLPGGYTTTGNVLIPSTSKGTLTLPLAATGARPAAIRANQIYVLNPEKIDSYELGFKSNFFDKRLSVDLTGFYYDYKNLVVNVPTQVDPLPNNATVLFRNAGAAEIKGVELRFNSVPFPGFQLSGSAGILDSEYTKDFGQTATILGARTPRTSKYTASLIASYTHGLPGGGALTYGVDGNWRSRYYFYPTIASQITAPDPLLNQKAFALFNAHVGWSVNDEDTLSFEVSVNNLTDKLYKNHALPVTSGYSSQLYGKPRSVLATVTARF